MLRVRSFLKECPTCHKQMLSHSLEYHQSRQVSYACRLAALHVIAVEVQGKHRDQQYWGEECKQFKPQTE